MQLEEINRFFGDIDLALMDALLKGQLPAKGDVLDLGCGEGRNAFYFIQSKYSYTGVDEDRRQIQLCEYVAQTLRYSSVRFIHKRIQELNLKAQFDIIICSRILHFAEDLDDFLNMWYVISKHLKSNGLVYIAMDSIIDSPIAKAFDQYRFEFPDGKLRFPLRKEHYAKMLEGFKEVEPLKTIIYHDERAQSFALLKRN